MIIFLLLFFKYSEFFFTFWNIPKKESVENLALGYFPCVSIVSTANKILCFHVVFCCFLEMLSIFL